MKARSRPLPGLLLGLLLSLVPAVATAQLDAVFANGDRVNRVCLGDGTGSFNNCSDVSADTNRSERVALGLVNGDAFLDAVFANGGRVNRVCLGDGTGSLNNCSNVSADTNSSFGVALGLVLSPEIFVDGFESGDTSA